MPTIETNADAETTMRLYRAIEAARAAAAIRVSQFVIDRRPTARPTCARRREEL